MHLSAITCTKKAICCEEGTLGPAYNEHPTAPSKFLCIKIIDCNVKKFGYNKQPLRTNSFFCMFSFVVSGIQCTIGYMCHDDIVFARAWNRKVVYGLLEV